MANSLNGNANTGVSQGSVLRPLSSCYINDLAEGLVSDVRLFADDTSFILYCV